MAKLVENTKGFLILEMSAAETIKCGGGGICDSCNDIEFTGYYIAVLNRWYCPKCYSEWIVRARRYESDNDIELRNYNHYLSQVNK